jgi:hypothetical protein
MFLFFHIVPLYYIFAEYYVVRRNNIFYYNWSVLEEVQNQQSDRDRFKQIARGGGDSAGNFPSWGIKETNDLAEPELHNLVHHLAVKHGTNQLLAIKGKGIAQEVNYIRSASEPGCRVNLRHLAMTPITTSQWLAA